MSVRVGVIGTGNIGTAHARNLTTRVAGSSVTAVYDADPARAAMVAHEVGARVSGSAVDLVNDPQVDAIVIASPDDMHAEQVSLGLAARKWVLCEKPLAPSAADCMAVMDAEVALGTRLVQLGFMRRFDPGYVQLKNALSNGSVGEALLLHCIHRNAHSPYVQSSHLALTNSLVHEMDTNRWLLNEEYSHVQVIAGRASPVVNAGVQDPMLVIMATASGVLIEIESFSNCQYGYDVRCEVVASMGTLELGDGSFITSAAAGRHGKAVADIWLERFDEAYRLQMQAWITSIESGTPTGASLWDGYAASSACAAAVESLIAGSRIDMNLVPQPGLYSH